MRNAIYGLAIAVIILVGVPYYSDFYESRGGMNARDEDGRTSLIRTDENSRHQHSLVPVDARTPLMRAAEVGNTKEIRKLLKAGAYINAISRDGATALILAAGFGHTEAVRELLEAGADIEARSNDGYTALVAAMLTGRTKATRELLKAGADIEARGNDGERPLMLAAFFGQTEAIRELLKAGADRQARDNDGLTAFDWWQGKQENHPDFYEIARLLKP